MGQAILPQHRLQRVDFGGNVHADVLQKGVVQLFIRLVQRVQDAGDVAADLRRVRAVRIAQALRRIQQLAGRWQVVLLEAAHAVQLLRVVVDKAHDRRAGFLHCGKLFVRIGAQLAAADF